MALGEAGEDVDEAEPTEPPIDEAARERWRRVARLAVLKSAERKWGQVIAGAVKSSQIGRSNSRASMHNQNSLRRAMEEARKLRSRSPLPPCSPIKLPGSSDDILRVLKDIDEDQRSRGQSPSKFPPDGGMETSGENLDAKLMAAVGYENEKGRKSPQPLLPVRSSPPKVVKRKAPGASGNISTVSGTINRPASAGDCIIRPRPISPVPRSSTLDQLSLRPKSPGTGSEGSRVPSPSRSGKLAVSTSGVHDPWIGRSRPRAPAHASRSVTPEKIPEVRIIPQTPEIGQRNEDRCRLVDPDSKSPRFRSPRRGGWL